MKHELRPYFEQRYCNKLHRFVDHRGDWVTYRFEMSHFMGRSRLNIYVEEMSNNTPWTYRTLRQVVNGEMEMNDGWKCTLVHLGFHLRSRFNSLFSYDFYITFDQNSTEKHLTYSLFEY
jgi:hypothetical protein